MRFKDLLKVIDIRQIIAVVLNDEPVEMTALQWMSELEKNNVKDFEIGYMHFNSLNTKLYIYFAR